MRTKPKSKLDIELTYLWVKIELKSFRKIVLIFKQKLNTCGTNTIK
jgi:hypothetical protein